MDPTEVETTTSKVEEEEEAINVTTATAEEEVAGAVGLFSPGEESIDKGALSPLTGSYLLIVLAEPHSEEDREIIIKRLTKDYEEEIRRATAETQPENFNVSHKEEVDPELEDQDDLNQGKAGVPFWFQKWPYVMPIQIDKKFEHVTQHRIKIALWHLSEAMDKCFKFKIVDPNCEIKGTVTKYFVKINRARGKSKTFCQSQVGKRSGGQEIQMRWYCDIFAIVHELIHTLGFYHEHTRSDRDQYVTVDYALMDKRKVSAGEKHQYRIDKKQKDYLGRYDFDSIMHYGFNDYFQPKKGKVPKGVKPGHVNHLSEGDIQRLKRAYPCEKAPGG